MFLSGTIRTGVTFDRETQEHYWLKILAKDTAAVPKYSVLFVYVKIGDTNDNCPMTAEPIYYTSVPENSPPDTVVARLEAFDLDSGSSGAGTQPSFRITAGNPQGFFGIHEKSGVIRTTSRKFDRETQPEHTLEVSLRVRLHVQIKFRFFQCTFTSQSINESIHHLE